MDNYARLNHDFEQKNGYAWKSEITGVLKGLGFSEEDFEKHVNTLSGGQKTRVSLGKLLLSRPDIIMLDEPTKLRAGDISYELSGSSYHHIHSTTLADDTCYETCQQIFAADALCGYHGR